MRRARQLVGAGAIALCAILCGAVSTAAGATPGQAPAELLGRAWQAYERGELERARALAESIPAGSLRNDDYRLFVLAQSQALTGDCRQAISSLRRLARSGSRFSPVARWRVADCQWELGQWRDAQRSYQRLLKKKSDAGDRTLAEYRIAAAHHQLGNEAAARRALRRFVVDHPLHPEMRDAESRLARLGEELDLDPRERLRRAERLKDAKKWHHAVAELERIGDEVPPEIARQRDYQLGMTLFSMRRQYARAGEILLGIYRDLDGRDAPRAMFHGARALSRADLDKKAIGWYEKVAVEYPRSRYAPEALFLAGWLDFNLGNYREGLPNLRRTRKKYPRSVWAGRASWFIGLSHFLLGEYDQALPHFERQARLRGRLGGGRGKYWVARTRQKLGQKEAAIAGYEALMSEYPFSWYALLAHARLREVGVKVSPFGESPRAPESAPPIALKVDPGVAADSHIRDADELIAAGLGTFAGYELRRGERAFLKRHGRAKGLAVLLDRYRQAGNFNRPWMLAVVYGGSRALSAPPKGGAEVWWKHGYPLAYGDLVEEHRGLGDNPRYWLYAIMRKESGYDPNVHSYADARGLLQMIPATTRRVVKELGMTYTPDLLFDPEANIKTASWYIGRLYHKFKGQIPMAAGSFNAGPRPVMKWLDKFAGRPMDVWMELVSYSTTREYMKKVTETYARYLYLYAGEVYELPLTVNSDYVKDQLTY